MPRAKSAWETKRKLLAQCGEKCLLCGSELNDETAQLDHIVPMWKGGKNDESNLRVVCPSCHKNATDRILDAAANPSLAIARFWIDAFGYRPLATSITTLVMIATLIFVVTGVEANKATTVKPNFEQQLEDLDGTQASLNNLSKFVVAQRNQLISNQQALARLQQEKRNLEPVLAANRETVQAIFAAQEARAAENAKNERYFGFMLGFISSVLASAFIGVLRYFFLQRKAGLPQST